MDLYWNPAFYRSRSLPIFRNMTSFIFKYFHELAEAETDDMVSLVKMYYGPLLQISMLFPSWKRSMIPVSLALGFLYVTMICEQIVILSYTAWLALLEGDYDLASLSAHYALIFSYCIFSLVWLNKDRFPNKDNQARLIRDIAIYKSGRIYAEEKCQAIKKKLDRETIVFLMIPGMVVILANCIIFIPYLTKWANGMENPYTPQGINLNLPVACWFPFPSHAGILHFVAMSNQLTGFSCLAIIIVSLLFMFLKFAQSVRYEFKVLHYSLETLFKRSKRLYFKMHPERRTRKFEWTDPVYQRVVGMCLKDSITHHKTIIDMLNIFMGMISIPALLAYGIGTAVIGLSLISAMNALNQRNYSNLILFGLLCVCESLNMFVVSLIGENLTSETVILRDELYDMEWHKLNLSNRKTMLNFQTAITEPYAMKAAGLVDLNMDTFSSIMNSAYSFFNLVNAQ